MSYKYQDDRKQFVNDYILNLRPYKPVPQEIWSVGPAERGELLKLDWNEEPYSQGNPCRGEER